MFIHTKSEKLRLELKNMSNKFCILKALYFWFSSIAYNQFGGLNWESKSILQLSFFSPGIGLGKSFGYRVEHFVIVRGGGGTEGKDNVRQGVCSLPYHNDKDLINQGAEKSWMISLAQHQITPT